MRRLKGRLAALALALAALAPASAADPATRAPVPLLWKVSDADNAVYLLGSFHLLREADYPLAADVYAALEDAETVLFEIPPEDMASAQAAQAMLGAALRQDGRTLDSELGPELAGRLREWLAANRATLAASGIPDAALQAMEPWFVGLLVTQMQLAREGMRPELGLDRHLAERARAAGKPTGGLETMQQVIGVLDRLPPEVQRQMLAEAMEDAQTHEALELHADWRRGRVEAMARAAEDMRRRYPDLYRRINVERNDAWLTRLDAHLRGGADDALAVVGALHLAGADGLLERLRAKGYRVERICAACAR
ncbi:MAG: TraB/GumN family protein [Pseudomonadota bacterium]|jgi:uncharacterized protein YbaP (TraB family)